MLNKLPDVDETQILAMRKLWSEASPVQVRNEIF